jgi:hypothetical protein
MSPTRYTVVSRDEADDELTTIWLNHPAERAAITRASHILESSLRHDADQQGTPCPTPLLPNLRMMDHGPLRVRFEVSEPDRLVRIIGYEKLNVTP